MSLPELQSLIASALGRPGDSASSASTGSAHAKLQQILSQLPVGLSGTTYQMGSATIGSGSASATATISSVDTTRSTVQLLGWGAAVGVAQDSHAAAYLTNATTVTVTDGAGFAGSRTIYFLVITWNNVKSLQQGTTSLSAVQTTNTTTITSVNTAKAIVIYGGNVGENPNEESRTGWAQLASATTVSGNRASGSASGTLTVYWAVVEFN